MIYRPLNSDETTQNRVGEDIQEPSPLIGEFSARVESMQGTEIYKADQTWGQNLYQVKMRHQPGIDFNTKMKIVWKRANGDKTLNILNINDVVNDPRPEISMVCRDYLG